MKLTFKQRVAVCLALDAVENCMVKECLPMEDEVFIDNYENFRLTLTPEQMADLISANKKLKGGK